MGWAVRSWRGKIGGKLRARTFSRSTWIAAEQRIGRSMGFWFRRRPVTIYGRQWSRMGRAARSLCGLANVQGQRVRILAGSQPFSAGSHELRWNGRNDAGSSVPAGVYLVRLTGEGPSAVQRIVLIR